MRPQSLPPSEMKSLYGSISSSAVSCLSYVTVAMISRSDGCSLRQRERRLAFLEHVGGKLGRVGAAGVLRRVDGAGRDEQDVAGLERHRRLALDVILQRAFEHVDDLLARMGVPGEGGARGEVDAHLEDLASADAEIVALQVGAPDPLLRPRRGH